MSTPQTLQIPDGVVVETLHTDRGPFAAHTATPVVPMLGHVLLVPGWTGSKEDFTPILPLLAGAGFAVTAFDQRGQFETPGGPDDDYSLAGLAADVIAVRATAPVATSHLLGHSFGGLVAQQTAATAPSQLRSLSLLCTGPGALGSSPQRPLEQMVQAIGSVPLQQIHAAREQGIRRPDDIAEFLLRRFTANSETSLRAITQLLIDAPDQVHQVVGTGLPAWVGRGVDDDAWPHDLQAQMAARLGTQIHVIAPAAHSPAVENPQGLIDAWLPFLQAQS